MIEEPTEIEFEVEDGQWIRIVGKGLGEPEMTQIVRRALEMAAEDNRPNAANRLDYERAAREFSSDAKLMDRGDKDRNELSENNEYTDVSRDRHRSSVDAVDELDDVEKSVNEGIDRADREHRFAARAKKGETAGRYTGGHKE